MRSFLLCLSFLLLPILLMATDALALQPPGLPGPLRSLQVGTVELGEGGSVVLRDVGLSVERAGLRLVGKARTLVVRLPRRGVRVEGLELAIARLGRRAATAGGPSESTASPATRLASELTRLVRSLGPVELADALVTNARGRFRVTEGSLELDPEGALRLKGSGSLSAAGRLSIRRLRADGTLGVSDDGGVRLEGAAVLGGLVVNDPSLAPEPVRVGRVSFRFVATADRRLRDVRFETSRGRLDSAAVDAELRLARRAGERTLSVTATIHEQDCAAAYGAIPAALMGRLRDSRWRGRIGFEFGGKLTIGKPRSLRLRLAGDPDTCVPDTLGFELDDRLAELEEPFAVPVRDPSGASPADLRVGPGAPGYVPWSALSRWVKWGALATEDRAFYHHEGARLRLIQAALRVNLSKERFFYGGSTITQQLVKNLFLTRQKSVARKVQELFLARELERRLDKQRILELYLNCIEYGPGVWGIGPAAQFYFGKPARKLDALESVFLMALKPSPKTGFIVFRRYRLNERWRGKMKTILTRLVDYDVITPEGVEAFAPYQPRFVPFEPERHGRY